MKVMHVFIFLLLFAGCSKSSNKTDTAPPKITIDDLTQVEGNGGQSNFELNVKLDVASSKAVTVHYRTNDGTAKANEDYIAIADATLTFAANETQKKIVVTVLADDLKEADEVFTVVLSAPGNASLAKSGANITIKNDDTRVDIPGDGYDAPTSYAGYTLAWSDEFNGDALNIASWAHQNGDGCPNLCGWGNNELEYYTERPDNLYFQDGKMIIEAKQENYNGKPYTSSKILTAGKQAFKFGRIDIRAKLPKGKGIWPAFWLLPQHNVYGGWPRSGEIDLMEMVGHEPNKVYGTLHFGPGPGSTQISRGYTLPSGNFNDAFHVFSLEWRQDQLKWYVDGNLFSTVNKADLGANNYPFNEKFYLIFNLAVGGNWPGNPDASTQFPQRMIVDYIRLYQ
jgi:beta-glucanase (GH16 family)